ncbi:hypothetical protein JAAARDRAFT_715282 [Jaapia argillacea MUCL 33604]|uniref:Uncharacterized protein n=1 Tax=Jaapia argillacea MUCL 33604 TaxID=933084 RepID=A0A067Q8U3_9AGAM|nr:hypothetical protein JAAARDRAFT_715282 [Jaapia argillacea MUCL 33604]
MLLPRFRQSANFSVGDLHFSQGDVSIPLLSNTAIEMAGIITFSTSIIKGGVEKFAMKQPMFLPSPIDPLYSSKVSLFPHIFNGDGKQYNMDATVVYKQAALNAIAYLQMARVFRLDLLLFTAPIESHVGTVVDSPNACVTLPCHLGSLNI